PTATFLRSLAARSLGRIGAAHKDVVPALTAALEDKEVLVRAAAARALGQIGPKAKDAAPALLKIAKRKELFAGEAAGVALACVDPENTPATHELLTGYGDDQFRQRVLKALAPADDPLGVIGLLLVRNRPRACRSPRSSPR